MASGTSGALPWPKPTRPLRSPTTTSAAKPKRRPPFTTLATRLMLTSFSVNSLSSRSRPCRSPSLPRRSPCERAWPIPSEIETALAGAIGQGFDPAVKQIGAAIEHDLRDPGRFGSLGYQLANGARRGNIGAGLEAGLQPAVEGRCRRQSPSGRVVDHLR